MQRWPVFTTPVVLGWQEAMMEEKKNNINGTGIQMPYRAGQRPKPKLPGTALVCHPLQTRLKKIQSLVKRTLSNWKNLFCFPSHKKETFPHCTHLQITRANPQTEICKRVHSCNRYVTNDVFLLFLNLQNEYFHIEYQKHGLSTLYKSG